MNNNRLEEKRNGGKKKELLYYIKNQAIRVVTEHPQGKNENEHVDVLQKLIFYSNSLYKN